MTNHYEILGVSQQADSEDIKKAAQEKSNELKNIFGVLSNADKRNAYDAELPQNSKAEPTYYQILAVNSQASSAEIKEAAQARMNEIKAAFEVLSDPEKRNAYHSELKEKEQSPAISLNRAKNDIEQKYQSPPPAEMEISPYQPPSAPIADPTGEEEDFELADRGTRLLAYLADGLIFAIPIFFVIAFAGFDAFENEEDTLMGLIGLFMIVWFLGLFVINMVLLYRHGQTIGKRWLSIKIVRVDRSRAGLRRIIFLRALPIGILSSIPVIGNIIFWVDALLIFRTSRRCLHDLFADTIVINTYQGPSKRRSTVMLVVSIILITLVLGILAAVAIPAYTDYLGKAKVFEAVSLLGGLKTPAEEYIAENGHFPPSVESIGGHTSGQYTANIVSNPYDFYFQATLSGEDTAIGDKTIRLTYDPINGKWICSPGSPNGMDDKYLPTNCRQ